MAIEIVIADSNAHPGLLFSIVTEGYAAQHTLFAKGTVVVVHEKQAGSRIAGYIDIRPTVLVEVGRDHGHAVRLRGFRNSGFLADVGERPITIVSVQQMPSSWQTSRAAFDWNALPIAIRVLARGWRMFHGETDVVRDKQIQVAIAVVIQEAAP